MSSAVVLLPGAPVLVPELGNAAAATQSGEVDRAARILAEAAIACRTPDTPQPRVTVLGQGIPRTRGVGAAHGDPDPRPLVGGSGTLRRWGRPVAVGTGAPHADGDLPDALVMAWWWLDRAGIDAVTEFVPAGQDPTQQVDGRDGPVRPEGADGLVVVIADGPAALAASGPLPTDARAVDLDARLADWTSGRGAFPDVPADTAEAIGWWTRETWLELERLVGSGAPAAEAISFAPFGVGYHVARWEESS